MKSIADLKVKIFADGADREGMLQMYRKPYIQGFTTNPTLMRKAGITDYRSFAHEMLKLIPDRPISFEVFADDFSEMERQARDIASWGDNVYVKIPVTNTRAEPTAEVVRRLRDAGVKINVTAITSLDQIEAAMTWVADGPPSYLSLFAGRVADTGRDPVPMVRKAVETLRAHPNIELIWASPRELLNLFQADEVGCHVITVTNDILNKLPIVGKSLEVYSLETVKMFHDDGAKAGYKL